MDRKAYAKINLSLDVVGLRKDGYHELDMLMVPLTDLYDVVSISEAKQDSFSVNIPIPWDERNLVFKALELFRTTYNIDKYYEITLEKHIPEQAGLGGGSSDAAVTLQLLYELNGITASRQEKIDLGKKLGADVPFFLFNRPARVQGIGEKLRYVDFPGGYKTMLIKPEGGISTQEAFRLLDSMSYEHVSIDGIEEAFRKGEIPGLCNSLEYSAVSLLPQIGELKQQCIDAGYTHTLMSGSGSTVFMLVPEETDLTEFSARMKADGYKVYESRIMWRAMPQLKTERLQLRHLRKDDAQAIFDTYASDPEVTRYLTWSIHDSVEVTEGLVDFWLKEYEKPDCYRYIIENRESGELMGMIDVVRYEEGIPVVGYVSGRKFWNQGYMTEAFGALKRQLLNDGYTNIIIEAVRENTGSNRVIEKNGFHLIGRRQDEFHGRQMIINTYHLFV